MRIVCLVPIILSVNMEYHIMIMMYQVMLEEKIIGKVFCDWKMAAAWTLVPFELLVVGYCIGRSFRGSGHECLESDPGGFDLIDAQSQTSSGAFMNRSWPVKVIELLVRGDYHQTQ